MAGPPNQCYDLGMERRTEDRDERVAVTQNLPVQDMRVTGVGEGQKAGQGAKKATTAWTQTHRTLTCLFLRSRLKRPAWSPILDSAGLTTHLLEGE